MTTVGYPEITEEFAAGLDPSAVFAALACAPLHELVEIHGGGPRRPTDARRLVSLADHSPLNIPHDRDHPRYAIEMAAALERVLQFVTLGDAVRESLQLLGVDTQLRITSHTCFGSWDHTDEGRA